MGLDLRLVDFNATNEKIICITGDDIQSRGF